MGIFGYVWVCMYIYVQLVESHGEEDTEEGGSILSSGPHQNKTQLGQSVGMFPWPLQSMNVEEDTSEKEFEWYISRNDTTEERI